MSYLYVCSMVVKRQDMDAAKNPWGVSTESSSSCSSILYSAAARISNQPIVATNSCLSGFGGICGRINAEHIHTLFFCPCRNFWALIGLTGAMSGGAERRSFNAEGAIRVERWWRLQAVYPKVTNEGRDGGWWRREDRTNYVYTDRRAERVSGPTRAEPTKVNSVQQPTL